MSQQYFVKLIAKVNRHAHAWPAFVKFCKGVRLQRALIRKSLTCYLTDIDLLSSVKMSYCTRKILRFTVLLDQISHSNQYFQ